MTTKEQLIKEANKLLNEIIKKRSKKEIKEANEWAKNQLKEMKQ